MKRAHGCINTNAVSQSLRKPQAEPRWAQTVLKIQPSFEAVIESETWTTAMQLI